MSDFTIILRSLRARLFSTVTTVLMVAVAVGLMLVLLSMRDAGRQAFSRGTGNMHLLVSRDASPMVSVLNAVFYANPPSRPLEMTKVRQIQQSFPFEFAIPTVQGDSFGGFPVVGTTPEMFTQFQPVEGEPWRLAAGRFLRDAGQAVPNEPAANTPDAHAFEVVVGSSVASAKGLKVGSRLYLTHGIAQSRQLGSAPAPEADDHDHDHDHAHDHDHDHGHDHDHSHDHAHDHEEPMSDGSGDVHREFTFRVVGVLAPTGSAHDRALFTHIDGSWVLHAHDKRVAADHSVKATTVADLTDDYRLVTGLYLRVATRPGQNATAAVPSVFDTLRRDPTVTVASPVQQINTLFRIIGNLDIIFVAMAATVMLSSGVGIMLAMYNSMNERRRQVAVLRVLGCSRPRVFSLVLTESAVIGLLGAALGVVIALAGAAIVSVVLKREVGVSIDPAIGLEWLLGVTVGAVALASLAGVLPAILAYRTSVANHLRPVG